MVFRSRFAWLTGLGRKYWQHTKGVFATMPMDVLTSNLAISCDGKKYATSASYHILLIVIRF